MPDMGARLQLFVGPTLPLPAPFDLADALSGLEVRNSDGGRDGFQMTFGLGKEPLTDYRLLTQGLLDPPARIVVSVMVGAPPPVVLIDGLITNHQFSPSDQPGRSTLVVTGEDISLRLDLEDRNRTYTNRSDSDIVTEILQSYAVSCGLVPRVTQTTDRRSQNEGITSQQSTDLAFVQELARRNGFVFYVQPTGVPGTNTAYWGPPVRVGSPQPALTLAPGGVSSVESLSFTFDALGPVAPQVTVVEPNTRTAIPVPVPSLSGLRPPLAARPVTPMRRTIPRDTAGRPPAEAGRRGLSEAAQAADALSGSGRLDAVRYGHVLRARSLVGVRGVGLTYDGLYYVKQVTHSIRRGEYKQSFSLSREGLRSTVPLLRP